MATREMHVEKNVDVKSIQVNGLKSVTNIGTQYLDALGMLLKD